MSSISRDLVATCWTTAGTAQPDGPSERSSFSARERISAAAGAGFVGLGFVVDDLEVVRDTIGLDALRTHADRVGIRHLEVELVKDWWRDPQAAPWRGRWDLLREAARAFDAPMVKIAPPPAPTVASIEPYVEPFRRLADEAAAIGTRLALEPLPFAGISSLPQGSELVRAVDHPHAGLVVDSWHVFRAGTSLDELRRTLDPSTVVGVEVNDADALPQADRTLFEDTRDNRRYPGEGAQDVVGFLRTMAEIGWSGPWGVEMLSIEHRAKSLADALDAARDTTLRCIRLAEAGLQPV
ncbi:sugar phosphate isomerase/epimerase family protein [Curtobacterium sp. MCPF17_002]|uniref:sugar phosphate isomerase/epimerase family protein n=1 Tax=Curtobacterium sp. MCPF17_002 TaxID=2175645 RepID=UPI000DAA59CE|nr:sugar phosphate isomerase/epimerase family protein [Curtobacterium sp. MCPF17_002]WIB77709.1 sugar phosphate isomerase/epimerase family protein [Curtobacterium sp. MCPF17_002]